MGVGEYLRSAHLLLCPDPAPARCLNGLYHYYDLVIFESRGCAEDNHPLLRLLFSTRHAFCARLVSLLPPLKYPRQFFFQQANVLGRSHTFFIKEESRLGGCPRTAAAALPPWP